MIKKSSFLAIIPIAIVILAASHAGAAAQSRPVDLKTISCNEFLVSKKEVKGKLIGQEDCRMQEVVVRDDSWPEVASILGPRRPPQIRRVDMGVSGTIEGFAVKEGPRAAEFTSAPEFVFRQAGNTRKPLHGVVRYDSTKGSGMTLLYPEDGQVWNGKLYVTVHGAGRSFRRGTLKAWDQNYDPSNPLGDISKFEKLMVVNGYAVAKTKRNTEFQTAGDYSVTLDDGTVLEGRNTGDIPELVLGFAQLAENLLQSRLGRKPSRTYWYGKSGGARLGRLVNYKTGVNIDDNGEPIVDGILADDSGAGLWLPLVFENGKDVLFRKEKDRQQFVKTIEIPHQLYNNERTDPVPDWVYTNFLMNKWKNAKVLIEKGLGDKFRMYEIRGVSHNGGEYLPNQKEGDVEILPLWHVIDAAIDLLDRWVDQDMEPPPTKSDWLELGDVDEDGINENEALALPEVACPLGAYYQYPPSRGPGGVGSTGFAPFAGQGLEPLDGRTVRGEGQWYVSISFADVNGNGYRDHRETVTEAWQRLGLLSREETFSRDRYTRCVEASVLKLKKDNFLTDKVAVSYLERATREPLPDWAR
ncbi:hypothetical protein MYX82_07345 [Acidobacteria bacterium AH-259-D05]|nr:hypothetical protein [Acidobacteria bacterium AH-259-D05]